MGILDTAKQASFQGPTRLALHSVEGFGKTTLAAFFPRPLFVCAETGFPRDLGHAPSFVAPKSWEEVLALVDDLITGAHNFESVVFDTMDWIEPMIWRFVCDRDTDRKSEINPKGNTLISIEDYGYGKGYTTSAEQMRVLIGKLDELQTKRAMHVVVLMHSWVKPFHNPAGDNFDRCARIIVEWSENVLFGYFEVTTLKDDPKDKKAKGASTGRRILGTRHNAMYDAKNRFNLPDTIELGAPPALVPYLLGKHIKMPHDAGAVAPGVTKPETKESAADTSKKIREEYEKTTGTKVADLVAAEQAGDRSVSTAAMSSAADMAKIGAMLDDVEKHCGPKLRKDVEKWIAAADTDEKTKWCFTEAAKHVAAAKKKASEQPAATA